MSEMLYVKVLGTDYMWQRKWVFKTAAQSGLIAIEQQLKGDCL
jgi:hypothetical protein